MNTLNRVDVIPSNNKAVIGE